MDIGERGWHIMAVLGALIELRRPHDGTSAGGEQRGMPLHGSACSLTVGRSDRSAARQDETLHQRSRAEAPREQRPPRRHSPM